MTSSPLPTPSWQRQAVAFLARCRAQMWGAHKEEPLAWLYRAGFSIPFAQEGFFGWNFRPMQRNAALWLGPEREGEKLCLPQGLVLPWIQEKEIRRLSILQPEGESLHLDGSLKRPLCTGKGPGLFLTFSDGDAFRLLQEIQDEAALMAAPDPLQIPLTDFASFGRIRLVASPSETARQMLEQLREKGKMAEACWLPEKGLIAGLLSGELSSREVTAMARF